MYPLNLTSQGTQQGPQTTYTNRLTWTDSFWIPVLKSVPLEVHDTQRIITDPYTVKSRYFNHIGGLLCLFYVHRRMSFFFLQCVTATQRHTEYIYSPHSNYRTSSLRSPIDLILKILIWLCPTRWRGERCNQYAHRSGRREDTHMG